MTNKFEEKHHMALTELAGTTMKTRYCLPPIHRLLWRLGVKIRPPHYASPLHVVSAIAVLFTIIWGSLLTALGINSEGLIVSNYIYSAMIGLVLGVVLAAYYRYGVTKHGLTPWDDLSSVSDETEADQID